MSYVHGLSSSFVNKDSGCQDPTSSNCLWSQGSWTQTHQLSNVMCFEDGPMTKLPWVSPQLFSHLGTPSLHPKMIILLPGFLGPKMILRFIYIYTRLTFEAQSQIISRQAFYIKNSFDTASSGSISEYYLKSHTYNHLVNGQRALILPKLQTCTIILGRREY
jgi:hypothetical protein